MPMNSWTWRTCQRFYGEDPCCHPKGYPDQKAVITDINVERTLLRILYIAVRVLSRSLKNMNAAADLK
jgi:hypothetical protein